jgi:hypothetical protein
MKKLIVLIILITLCITNSFTQENTTFSKWSIEASVVYPIFGVYKVNAGYTVIKKEKFETELLFGPCYQNWSQDIGTAHGYSLILGARFTFFKYFNFEYAFYPSYNEFESAVDNNIYKGFDGFQEFMIGFKFNVLKKQLFINIQAVHGDPLYNTSTWPEPEDASGFPVVFPNITIGYRLK